MKAFLVSQAAKPSRLLSDPQCPRHLHLHPHESKQQWASEFTCFETNSSKTMHNLASQPLWCACRSIQSWQKAGGSRRDNENWRVPHASSDKRNVDGRGCYGGDRAVSINHHIYAHVPRSWLESVVLFMRDKNLQMQSPVNQVLVSDIHDVQWHLEIDWVSGNSLSRVKNVRSIEYLHQLS